MLVLSREQYQSVVMGERGNLMELTVMDVRSDEIFVNVRSFRSAERISPTIVTGVLKKGDHLALENGTRVELVDIRAETHLPGTRPPRVRLGFVAIPHHVIHRREVWDAIQPDERQAAILKMD